MVSVILYSIFVKRFSTTWNFTERILQVLTILEPDWKIRKCQTADLLAVRLPHVTPSSALQTLQIMDKLLIITQELIREKKALNLSKEVRSLLWNATKGYSVSGEGLKPPQHRDLSKTEVGDSSQGPLCPQQPWAALREGVTGGTESEEGSGPCRLQRAGMGSQGTCPWNAS